MIDEKLKEFFNKFPHIKENKPLQNTLSKKINNLIKKEIQHGASQVEAEQKALLNLTDLDTMLSQLKSLEENDYVKYNDFFSNHFAILGNSGSGKSCGVARILQNVFHILLQILDL